MAFNTGLRLNDGNPVARDTIVLGGQDQAFFQTQLVNGAKKAYGATVFTIRPDANDDGVSGAYQSLLVGQNFVVGLQYNTAGDQYRIVVQSRDAYDLGAGTRNPAFGTWVDVEVETTFGLNLNDNGTLTYIQNGFGAQGLSIPAFTSKTVSATISEATTPGATDVAHILLDDGRGNIVDVEAIAGGATAGALVTALRTAFDALKIEQKSGFELAAPSAGHDIVITRTDGAGFTVRAGVNHTAGTVDAGGILLNVSPLDASGAPTDFFDRNFDGFVSQVAIFIEPLTISELSGYVNQPGTIPETVVNSDGEEATALITFPGTQDSKIYEVVLDDDNGNTLTLNHTTNASATVSEIIAGFKADYVAATNKAGYTFDDSVANQLKITRADGADFSINTGASTYQDTNEINVNGVDLDSTATTSTTFKEVYSSKTIAAASVSITEEEALVANSTSGVTYEIVLDDGAGDILIVNAFLPSGSTTVDDALDALFSAAAGLGSHAGYTFGAVVAGALPISRADGRNFTVKLGTNDEASNLEANGEPLATDSTVSSTNGVRSGVPHTISNKVAQNFDFTALNDATTVVSQASDNYAGEAILLIYGMDKAEGPNPSKVAQLGTNSGYPAVDSSGYTGTVVSVGGLVSSDVLFGQIRDVEDSGVANRKFTVDLFVDPYLITDGEFSALSYTVAWDAAVTLDSLTQQVSTGGFRLADIDRTTNYNAEVRWFKPTPVTDFSTPIATLVFTDTVGTTDPTLTFSSIDIDGTDFSDNLIYTASFADTLSAELWDIGDRLVSGNDSSTGVEDQLVIVEGARGGTANAPVPTSAGLYLMLDAYDDNASADAPDVDYTIGVYASNATNIVSFEIDLPVLADTGATNFVLNPALSDWTATSEIQGRKLVVEMTGGANMAAGTEVGKVITTVRDGFDTTQYFELANVQTDTDAANENARGLYVAATRTDASGDWAVADMPTGIMTRAYVGTAEIPSNAVTALDAYYALQMSAGLVPNWWNGGFNVGQAVAADFDSSGKVTAADALAILQYSVGISPIPDPVQWVFFDSETNAITNANTVDRLAALAENTVVTTSNPSLGLGDEVVLVGDLSNPAG
jgi:hypothetical protein